MKLITTLIILLMSFSSNADTNYQYNIKHFDITALDIKTIVASIKTQGPISEGNRVWAMIKWDINTEYHFESNEKSCRFVTENVDVIVEVTLPNWISPTLGGAETFKWWKTWYEFLDNHENAHYENLKNGVEVFTEKIANLPPQLNCNMARLAYLKIKHETLNQIKADDNKTDYESQNIFSENGYLNKPFRSSGLRIDSGMMSGIVGVNQ